MEASIVEFKTPWPLVNIEEERGELVVSFHAEAFLWPSVEETANNLFSLVDETEAGPLVLDFGNVEHVTGVGREKLALLSRQMGGQGRRLVLKNVDHHLAQNIAASGLAKECAVMETETRGLAAR